MGCLLIFIGLVLIGSSDSDMQCLGAVLIFVGFATAPSSKN